MIRRQWFILALGVVAACGGGGLRPADSPNPQDLLSTAMSEYRQGKCTRATLAFERLTFELAARDPLQGQVRYYLAECQLRGGEELEAARQFRRVADEFPQHALAPDALLRTGDAYSELWRKPGLDPTQGENAINVWRELMGRYPSSPAAARARIRVRELNAQFAAKAFDNGEFYRRFKAFDSAILYYREVVATYPESPHASRAVLALIATYDRIGYREERDEMCGYLRQYYPEVAEDAPASCPRPTTP